MTETVAEKMTPKIPEGFRPELIGQVITIQVFEREETDSDTLVYDSLQKFVGTLVGYGYTKETGFYVTLAGDVAMSGDTRETHYEVILP